MGEKPNSFVSVIMAGGSGTRFWPASTKEIPKQYLRLFSHRSLIQETVDRLLPLQNRESIYIASGSSQGALLKEQLPEIHNLILEPVARNTAPCLMLAARELLSRGLPPSTVMAVFPADHRIEDGEAFRTVLQKAVSFAASGDHLVTLGIAPTSPHTGYGYIESSQKEMKNPVPVKRFIEKPPIDKAREFLNAGTFYWNCGIFIWSLASIVKAFEHFQTEDWTKIRSAKSEGELASVFASLKSQPIDTAILEKARNVYVLRAQTLGWSDVGSWNALYELRGKPGENVTLGDPIESVESTGCLVDAPGKTVALIGVKDLVIVEANGRILVMAREKDQQVRLVAEKHP